jgi:hypothetical protein
MVFNDANNNAAFDPGETGISGWTIKLEGAQSATVSTNGNGIYQFDNLLTGSYTLTQVARPSWTQTTPVSPKAYNFTLTADTPTFSGNFGNYSSSAYGYPVMANWNVLSVPLAVSDARTSAVFPSAISSAFSYEAGYSAAETLRHGEGYWIKFRSAQTAWVAGTPILNDTIGLQLGWNMIGSISDSVPLGAITTLPPGIITSSCFGYTTGYVSVNVLVPGQGYWVKTSQAGSMILSSGPAAKVSVAEASTPFQAFRSLSIADAGGNSQKLYFGTQPCEGLKPSQGSGEGCAGTFELPPVPPRGIFDARYATGTMLETADPGKLRDIPILVSSARFPITVSWSENKGTQNAALVVGEREIPMLGTDVVRIIDPADRISLRLARASGSPADVPHEFALNQNFPNPFNPSTVIRYQLPVVERSGASLYNVSLKIYNTLGQVVATLVDGTQNAGYKSVSWDAAKFASGVYFYGIEAESVNDPATAFRQIRKMVLTK